MNYASVQRKERSRLTPDEVKDIVADLDAAREAEGLGHEDFAWGRLGIDPANWWRIRNGRQGIGVETMIGIAAAYPHINKKLQKMLASKANPYRLRKDA